MNFSEQSSTHKTIKVLYEDEHFIVFDKSPGLLVVPSPKNEKNTLQTIVNQQISSSDPSARLFPCHRLDRDTSGVILFARGKENQDLMMEEFKHRRVHKTYIAFVQGKLRNPAGEIKSMIRDFEQVKYQKHSSSKLAITRYKVLTVRRQYSVVEVNPITGRTNQIRIHFSQIGHPLLGERKYAFGKDSPLKFRRTALHALSLKWRHPIYKKEIQIQSPLPEDMERFRSQN